MTVIHLVLTWDKDVRCVRRACSEIQPCCAWPTSTTQFKELRRLFLVDDLVDSLKFAVLMWVFTYVGALFNGLTLMILAVISLFSIPVIYEKHQVQIDHYLGLVNKNVKDAVTKIQDKIPGLKRKTE
uniref:Reticulon n=1 Tax=Gekko japonicus TaxID=146911 RepID=Q5EI09_GEKJA|nr:GekBS142P [Gekko japonicus]